MALTTTSTDYSDTDFCDPSTFDDPWDLYRWLRDESPIHRDEKNKLWILSRHEDVFAISREPSRYCNRFGVRPNIAADMSLIAMDGEEHTAMRRLINRGFTPRRVRELVPHVREITNEVIDEVGERGRIEFIEDFAIHVPLIVISELIGLDPETRKNMYRWSDDMMAGDGAVDDQDPRLHAAAIAFGEYAEVCKDLITARRADPTDDLISVLTAAYDDGALEKEKLSGTEVDYEGLGIESMADDDLQMFLTLLLVAGNETTRNAIAGGMKVLSEFPEERARLVEHIDDGAFVDLAVDELIRFVSPVMTFMRTVTETHDYKGHTFEEGDRVFMLYQSANRDERVFDEPDRLILDRDPNPHLAFGTGAHFCLGANLARMEVKVVFEELFRRLPDIRASEGVPIVRGASSLVLALQEMQAEFTKESECPVAH